MKLNKIVEKPISDEEISKIKWLYKGIVVLDERLRKEALEKDVEFMEKEGKYMTPDEFHSILFSRPVKKIGTGNKYKQELDRYHNMLVNNISEVLDINSLKGVELGRMIGVPNAKENLFEIKQKGKVLGFVHLNEQSKTIDFVIEMNELPKEFKKKLEGKK